MHEHCDTQSFEKQCHWRQAGCLVQIQDKIGFMINNLSLSNVNEKAKELKGFLTEEYWDWFCTYIVIKRAAQEHNFQHLYEALVTALQVRLFPPPSASSASNAQSQLIHLFSCLPQAFIEARFSKLLGCEAAFATTSLEKICRCQRGFLGRDLMYCVFCPLAYLALK